MGGWHLLVYGYFFNQLETKILLTFLNMLLLLKWQGYESRVFCVNCILEIYGILNMAQALNITRFKMYSGSQYARFSHGILTGFLIHLGS